MSNPDFEDFDVIKFQGNIIPSTLTQALLATSLSSRMIGLQDAPKFETPH